MTTIIGIGHSRSRQSLVQDVRLLAKKGFQLTKVLFSSKDVKSAKLCSIVSDSRHIEMRPLGHGPASCTSHSPPQPLIPKKQCNLLPGASARRKHRLHSQLAITADALSSRHVPSGQGLGQQAPTFKHPLPHALLSIDAQHVSVQQTDAEQPARQEAQLRGVASVKVEGMHGRRSLLSTTLVAATVAAGSSVNAALHPNAAHALRTVSNSVADRGMLLTAYACAHTDPAQTDHLCMI